MHLKKIVLVTNTYRKNGIIININDRKKETLVHKHSFSNPNETPEGRWTLKKHKFSDESTRNIIQTILILSLRNQNEKEIRHSFTETLFYLMPKEIIMSIFEYLPINAQISSVYEIECNHAVQKYQYLYFILENVKYLNSNYDIRGMISPDDDEHYDHAKDMGSQHNTPTNCNSYSIYPVQNETAITFFVGKENKTKKKKNIK